LRLPSFTPAAFRAIPQLMKIGIPIAVVGAAYTLLYTADRWVILAHFPAIEMGHYALAARMASVGLLVSTIIADQMYPRVAEQYGRTGDSAHLKPLLFRQQVLMLGIMVPVVAAFYVAAPMAMFRFYPDYAAAVPIVKILLVGYLFLCCSGAFGVILNVLHQQPVYLAVQGVSLAMLLSACLVVAKLGGTLNAVAMTVSAIFAIYALLLWIVTDRVIARTQRRPKAVLAAGMPCA
jgi:O-antigen/teichoic acid export membrane protein